MAGGDGNVQLPVLQQLCGGGGGRQRGQRAVIGGAAGQEGAAGTLGAPGKSASRHAAVPTSKRMPLAEIRHLLHDADCCEMQFVLNKLQSYHPDLQRHIVWEDRFHVRMRTDMCYMMGSVVAPALHESLHSMCSG